MGEETTEKAPASVPLKVMPRPARSATAAVEDVELHRIRAEPLRLAAEVDGRGAVDQIRPERLLDGDFRLGPDVSDDGEVLLAFIIG